MKISKAAEKNEHNLLAQFKQGGRKSRPMQPSFIVMSSFIVGLN